MADTLQNTPLTINLANNGLVAGTTNTVTSTAATNCVIQNRFATPLGVLTNSATTPTVDAVTGVAFTATPLASTVTNGVGAMLVFGVNLAGTLRAVLGTPVLLDGLGVTTTPGNFVNPPQPPALPDDFCPIAYTLIRTSPTTPVFTVGVTSWANGASTFRALSGPLMRPVIT